MAVIPGQAVMAYPLPDEELSPTSKNAVSNEAVCEGLDEIKNTLSHKADAIYDTASGDIASFPDGAEGLPVKDLTVGIEPVQDLHGYDYPWPAGGGKNKLNASSAASDVSAGVTFTVKKDGNGNVVKIETTGTSTSNYSGCFINLQSGLGDLKIGETYTFSINKDAEATAICIYALYKINDGAWAPAFNPNTRSAQFTIPEGITAFLVRACINESGVNTNGMSAYPMIRIASDTDPTFAPYSNICPISGWTGANVTRTGKNLLNFQSYTGIGTWLGSYIFPVLGPYLYRRATFSGNGQYSFRLYGIKNGVETALDNYGYSASMSGANAVSQYDHIRINGYSNNASNTLSEVFVGFGDSSVVPPYEPFGTTIPISWQSSAGTVYGGTLDVTTGVLTVDKVCKTLTTAINLSGTYQGSIIYNNYSPETADADLTKPFICNRLKYVGHEAAGNPNWVYGTCINAGSASFNLWVSPTAFADLAAASAWLAENETQICYWLKNPQTYQLDPVIVTTLLGQNNIWSDTGSSTVEYPADTKLYIDKKLAALVAALS